MRRYKTELNRDVTNVKTLEIMKITTDLVRLWNIL